MATKDILDPWFITGFSDAEAAFTFSSSITTFALYYSITQRADNREIIEKIQKYFGGIGKIYLRKETLPTKNSGHTRPSVSYRVYRQNDLLRIIEHFDKFPLQSNKQNVYRVWREMAIAKIEYIIGCNTEQFRTFSERMSVLNSKSRAFKIHKDNKWLK